jgi:hypothetical protein
MFLGVFIINIIIYILFPSMDDVLQGTLHRLNSSCICSNELQQRFIVTSIEENSDFTSNQYEINGPTNINLLNNLLYWYRLSERNRCYTSQTPISQDIDIKHANKARDSNI